MHLTVCERNVFVSKSSATLALLVPRIHFSLHSLVLLQRHCHTLKHAATTITLAFSYNQSLSNIFLSVLVSDILHCKFVI
jgi:hypothetical protein